jgi:hypothetical protein
MPTRPTGSLALTLAAATISAAAAFIAAGLLHSPDMPVRPLVEAWLARPVDGETGKTAVVAADTTSDPETTGTIVLPLRREN